jgi:hypothetical protein
VQKHVHARALEDRLDQLVKAARDDVHLPAGRLRALDELAEAGSDLRPLQHPGEDFIERRRDRLELADDHVAERHRARVEPVLDFLVHGRVAEDESDLVEQVVLGDGAVEVDDDGAPLRAVRFRSRAVTHGCGFRQYDRDGEEVGCALRGAGCVDVIDHLLGVEVRVVVRNRHCQRIEVELPRTKGADDEVPPLKGLVRGRRHMDPARDRLEVVDVERPRVDVPVPADRVEAEVLGHVAVPVRADRGQEHDCRQ